jgi:hypothetical protein
LEFIELSKKPLIVFHKYFGWITIQLFLSIKSSDHKGMLDNLSLSSATSKFPDYKYQINKDVITDINWIDCDMEKYLRSSRLYCELFTSLSAVYDRDSIFAGTSLLPGIQKLTVSR